MNFQGLPSSYTTLTPEVSNAELSSSRIFNNISEIFYSQNEQQIKFEEEFSKWEQNFKNWQRQNQMNVNHQSYKQYEQKFLDIRDKLLEKRTQIYSKKPMVDIRQEYDFQLTKAASAAEDILRRFPANFNETSPRRPTNPFGFIENDRDQRIRDPPIANNNRPMMGGMNNQSNNWPPSAIQEPLSDYPNNQW